LKGKRETHIRDKGGEREINWFNHALKTTRFRNVELGKGGKNKTKFAEAPGVGVEKLEFERREKPFGGNPASKKGKP